MHCPGVEPEPFARLAGSLGEEAADGRQISYRWTNNATTPAEANLMEDEVLSNYIRNMSSN